jgi:hypothetical protein
MIIVRSDVRETRAANNPKEFKIWVFVEEHLVRDSVGSRCREPIY